jgi:hypothetical protein
MLYPESFPKQKPLFYSFALLAFTGIILACQPSDPKATEPAGQNAVPVRTLPNQTSPLKSCMMV